MCHESFRAMGGVYNLMWTFNFISNLPALKKSLSSLWKILNCSTNASLYSPGFWVILASIASVATKSSGPALRWSLFCIVCFISCWNLKNKKLIELADHIITKKIHASSAKNNLEVMRDIIPMSNISNTS